MATVSILVPAFKSEYLVKTLISARDQTFDDIEILVGDDTADARLRPVVEMLNDPRIRYFHHGFEDGLRNCQELLRQANGKYIKWLFDDDVLMPTSVEVLIGALRTYPHSPMAFHERVFIDANDKVIHRPMAMLKTGTYSLIDRQFLVDYMVAHFNNFIGEPSNIMINRELIEAKDMIEYYSHKLTFLADVGMYLNFAYRGPLVAVGGYLSCFRQHPNQNSNADSPFLSAGLYEWELITRAEATAGNLDPASLSSAKETLWRWYTDRATHFPELSSLKNSLHELTDDNEENLLYTAPFRKNLADAYTMVKSRVTARIKNKKLLQNFCVVCEKDVDSWIPHPEADKVSRFLTEVNSVGSTLEKHNCPHCYCNDRDRHLWLYITRTGLLKDISQKRILHIAPEARLEPRIKELSPKQYIAGDLFPRLPHHLKINIESLDFPNESFDLIICNHVLEHVDDPKAALAEFNRCLSHSGHLIAQTPYSPLLKNTFELTQSANAAFKTYYYGQDDHVRLFGSDILNYFHDAGFQGDMYPHTTLLGNIDADKYGLNQYEPFFLFSKGGMPSIIDLSTN